MTDLSRRIIDAFVRKLYHVLFNSNFVGKISRNKFFRKKRPIPPPFSYELSSLRFLVYETFCLLRCCLLFFIFRFKAASKDIFSYRHDGAWMQHGECFMQSTFQNMDHMTRILDLIAVGSKTGKDLALIVVSCSLGKTFGTRQNFWN